MKLQRAAHSVDIRLNKPVEWIGVFHEAGGRTGNTLVRQWIFERPENPEGVTAVQSESS